MPLDLTLGPVSEPAQLALSEEEQWGSFWISAPGFRDVRSPSIHRPRCLYWWPTPRVRSLTARNTLPLSSRTTRPCWLSCLTPSGTSRGIGSTLRPGHLLRCGAGRSALISGTRAGAWEGSAALRGRTPILKHPGYPPRCTSQAGNEAETTSALALRAAKGLQLTPVPGAGTHALTPASAADYLVHKRSWRGVDAPLAGAAPAAPRAAVEGRSGRAAGYREEHPG